MKQAGTIFFFFLLILFPKISVEGARQGLILWGLTLVPTLLPFFIVTKSILQWKIPGNLLLPYLFFVGYFCGYPTGAVIVNQLYLSGALTKKQSNLFICFCNHASPAFLFNFVYYNYFRTQCSAWTLLFPVYLSSVLWTAIFCLMIHSKDPFPQQANAAAKEQRLEDIFMESVSTIMKIGCFMLLFSIFIQISFSLFSKRSIVLCTLSCFLEITNGVHILSSCPFSTQLKTALIGALCSFGGFCSIAQVRSALSKELSIFYYFIFKLCTGVTTFVLIYLAV